MTTPRTQSSAWAHFAAISAAFLAFSLYCATLAPTITGEDAGELVTAAYTLGIPHPSGYPLWCLMAHMFTWLPWGEVAWRVALLSAVFGAGTVYLTVLLLFRMTGKALAAFLAGLLLTASRQMWEQSTYAEVYTLNAFLLLLALYLLWRWQEERREKLLYFLALVCGLGLANHPTYILLLPLFALFVLINDAPIVRRVPQDRHAVALLRLARVYLSCTLIALLLAFAFYCYLPIRSSANPVMDWGNPETLQGWWRHFTRWQYAHMNEERPRSLALTAWQVSVFLRLWIYEFTPLAVPVSIAGFVIMLKRSLGWTVWLFFCGLLPCLGACYALNFSYTQESLWTVRVFSLPLYCITALLIGRALANLLERWRMAASLALGAVLLLASLYVHWEYNDKSSFRCVARHARAIMTTLPADAVLVAHADHLNFPMQYFQSVEGVRPDVIILRKYGYLDPEVLHALDASIWQDPRLIPRLGDEAAILDAVCRLAVRPVVFESPPPDGAAVHIPKKPNWDYFIACGTDGENVNVQAALLKLNEAALASAEACLKEVEASARSSRLRTFYEALPGNLLRGDYTRRLIAQLAVMKGFPEQARFSVVEMTKTREKLESAVCGSFGPDPYMYNRAGVLAARKGEYALAAAAFRAALHLDPGFVEAGRNLARAEARLAATGFP